MDIRQLQYLVVLSEEKHFTKAAAACNVTQPTLSGRIRQLELELGVPLVARGKKYFGLTQEGERVVVWARKILSDCRSLRHDALGENGALPERVSVAVVPSAAPMVGRLVGEMRSQWPTTHINIAVLPHNEILDAVSAYRVDCGITYIEDIDPLQFAGDLMFTECYRMFVCKEHPLASCHEVTMQQVSEYPMVALSDGLKNREFVDAAFRRTACWREPDIECDSFELLVSTLPGSQYTAIMPTHYESASGGLLQSVKLVDAGLNHPVGLVSLRRDLQPVLLEGLREFAQAVALEASKHGATAAMREGATPSAMELLAGASRAVRDLA
ncbi:LysR family transcriptional regulator [Polycladidibacter hongkongensis]|uniref:LysR family transcriptional regulator n=1 Tax=Polycladidibacter hongkongensis TaxID=1647556 RepID=UPI0008372C4B|nr:LysR family transcriptional regulator [Pseudovibrio hongkongensis]